MTSRLGIMFPCRYPQEQLPAFARAAEQAGLDEIWVVEDCFYAGGIAGAATALAVTERITVGIGILPAVARNAAFVAMDLASLARLHPGRLLAGFGHGVAEWMDQVGARPRSPLASLEETMTAVRRVLAGERVTCSGRYVALTDVELEFPPDVVPPLVAGVRGPRSLALSGRVADGTLLAEPAGAAYVRSAGELVRAGAEEAGVTRPHTMTAYNWFVPGDDLAAARQRLAGTLAGKLDRAAAHLEPLEFGAELLDLLAAGGPRDELAARLPAEWLDDLGIYGGPDHCAAQVATLAAAGCDSSVLVPVPGSDLLDAAAAAGAVRAALGS